MPEQLRTREGRRQALREAKKRLNREREQATEPVDDEDEDRVEVELDPQRFVTRTCQRRGCGRREPSFRDRSNACLGGVVQLTQAGMQHMRHTIGEDVVRGGAGW